MRWKVEQVSMERFPGVILLLLLVLALAWTARLLKVGLGFGVCGGAEAGIGSKVV